MRTSVGRTRTTRPHEPAMAPSLARSGTPTILSTTPAGRPWPARHLVVPGVSALDRCTKTKNTGQNLRNTRGRHIERLMRPVQNEAPRRNRAASRRTCGKQTIPSRHEKRQHRRQPSFEPLEHRSSSLRARAQATRTAAYTPSEKTPSLDASIHDMTKTQYAPHPLRYIYLRILPFCQIPVKAICTKKTAHPILPILLDRPAGHLPRFNQGTVRPSERPLHAAPPASRTSTPFIAIPLLGYILRGTFSQKKSGQTPACRALCEPVGRSAESNSGACRVETFERVLSLRTGPQRVAAQSRDCMGGSGPWKPAVPRASLTKRRSIAILLLTFTLR